MNRIINIFIALFVLASCSLLAQTNTLKPRIINLTDIGADPDDEESMVCFLVQSNEYDVEGLIVTTGCWKKYQSSTSALDNILNAYGKVVSNLKVHSPDFPSLAYLQSISALGQQNYGIGDVGSGKDSPGSELIISAVDKDDPRPIWICFWGGGNTLAQAIWKVKNTRSAADFQEFISKIRIYDVLGQDNAGTWIAKNFPDIIYIRATGVYGWQPNDSWFANNVQNHGDLGAVFPTRIYSWEGDTPSFLHVFPNGLNNPDEPWQGGWGGRFERNKKSGIRGMSCMDGEDANYDTYYMYGNTSAGASDISRWSNGYNNDFQARMDWTIKSNYSQANHHPIAIVNGDVTKQILKIEAQTGTSIQLSAAGSTDPDGQTLSYKWYFYKDPGTYNGYVTVQGNSTATPTIQVPSDANGKEIHIILELTDAGSPSLTAYRRVIINATNEVVSDIPVTGVGISPTTATVNVGATTQLMSTVSPSNASNKNVSWSSGNFSIASVSSSGMVTGVTKGSAAITVTTEDGSFSATCHVSVTNTSTPTYDLSTSVTGQGSVSPSSGTFSENESVTLTATPASDWKFVNWSGDASDTSASITITMNSDKEITANFEAEGGIGEGCDSPVTISLPLSNDGAGEFCWQTADDISYVNSWNLQKLEINGIDFTNTWSDEIPPKQDGYYNIHYVAEYSWAHLEIASTKSAEILKGDKGEVLDFAIHCFPNPVGDQLNIQFSREIKEVVDVYLVDVTGKVVLSDKANGLSHTMDMSGLPIGIYTVKVSVENQDVTARIVKQ